MRLTKQRRRPGGARQAGYLHTASQAEGPAPVLRSPPCHTAGVDLGQTDLPLWAPGPLENNQLPPPRTPPQRQEGRRPPAEGHSRKRTAGSTGRTPGNSWAGTSEVLSTSSLTAAGACSPPATRIMSGTPTNHAIVLLSRSVCTSPSLALSAVRRVIRSRTHKVLHHVPLTFAPSTPTVLPKCSHFKRMMCFYVFMLWHVPFFFESPHTSHLANLI